MSDAVQTIANGFAFEVVSQVIKPVIKMEVDVPRYVKLLSPIVVGKELKADKAEKAGDKKKGPAHIADAVNLETGETGVIVFNAVLRGAFEDSYPNASYVGKCFAVTKLTKREGKDYNDFKLLEIQPKAQSVDTAKAPAKSK